MLEERLLKILRAPGYTPLDAHGLRKALHLKAHQSEEFDALLATLERAGRVARVRHTRYALPLDADLVPGRIRMNRRGAGVLHPDDTAIDPISVPAEYAGTAMHEDKVLVRREFPPGGRRPGDPAGRVLRILERARTNLVGTLMQGREFLYVVPDQPRIPHDIYVPAPSASLTRRPAVGDKVVVELAEWTNPQLAPEGRIVEVLGAPSDPGVDMESILREYELPKRFPDEVVDEALRFGAEVRPSESKGRTDCREHLVVTIDPPDARDFDDAISIRPDGEGRWRLWVHIADVSHYVKPGTALDREAQERGNSTYLVDRVIPMLPEELSNELCSLKPDVDRLTKCVEFGLAADGRVLETKFYPAVIRSKRRFAYREVLAVLRRKPAGVVEHMLHDAHRVAQKIRASRFKAGALNLDFPEMKIWLNDRGGIDRIERVENDESHQLIEEFMLLANDAVAKRLRRLQAPALYRVHENPDPAKLQDLRAEAAAAGYPCGDLTIKKELQKLLDRLSGDGAGEALKVAVLRSMKRARYDAAPLGHYGLSKPDYTHFTSPIRRYADLVVHRALFEPKTLRMSQAAMARAAEHISITERNSADAERDSRDVKLFAFLEAQLTARRPETYEARVIEVRNFGFFVDVGPLGMSGLVPVSSMEDDFYVFDPAAARLRGRRNRRVIGMGDVVAVQILKVDRFKKQADFRLAPGPGPASGPKPKPKPKTDAPRRRRRA